MYYQIDTTIKKVKYQDINDNKITLGLITLSELKKTYEQYGFAYSTLSECKSDNGYLHNNLDVYEEYSFGILKGINSDNILQAQDRMGIYIKKNLFLIVLLEDEDRSIGGKVSETLDRLNLNKVTLERLICGFFDRLIYEDHGILESIEKQISDHEDEINEGQIEGDFNLSISDLRKKLLLLYNYFEQLITIGEELQENGNDLFEEENLRYFKIFTDRVSRLSDHTRMLRDYIAQIKEAYQAQLDYNLNNTMKLFTVVTTIFLPLTLIVGWYGMNFSHMPELGWKWGYPFVMGLSILVILVCILFFKKKKFL